MKMVVIIRRHHQKNLLTNCHFSQWVHLVLMQYNHSLVQRPIRKKWSQWGKD